MDGRYGARHEVTCRARLDEAGVWRAVFGNESREPYVFLLEPLPERPDTLDMPVACFTDNRGTRWRPDTHGDLHEVHRRS